MSGLRKRDGNCDSTTPTHPAARAPLRAEGTHGIRSTYWVGAADLPLMRELAAAGWRVVPVDVQDAASTLARTRLDVALVDFENSTDVEVAVLEDVIHAHPEVQWLAIAARPTLVRVAVRRLIVDACFDYFTRPLHVEYLSMSLGHAWGKARLLHAQTMDTVADPDDLGLVGQSPALQAVRAKLRKFAPVDMPVLITGETGTGKDVAARALWSLSARSHGAFGAIDCGALPETLVQSELFGHERGAFTGAAARKVGRIEAANGGVVFLDEIGDLPLDAQSNLLRFLQEGTVQRVGSTVAIAVDVRVIAATHVDLQRAVREGRFREDLYYRLHVLHLELPPLRARVGDAELLAAHFLAEFRRAHHARVQRFSAAARRAIAAHSWPGNVRELVNRVRSAAVLADRPLIQSTDLGLTRDSTVAVPDLHAARARTERETIVDQLRASGFNMSECARRLNVSRMTLYRLCRKYGLKIDSAALPLLAIGWSFDGAARATRWLFDGYSWIGQVAAPWLG